MYGFNLYCRRRLHWNTYLSFCYIRYAYYTTIIGVQFIRHFNGLLNKLGWGMLASLIIVISAAALISEDEFSMTNTIISFIEFWIISYILYIPSGIINGLSQLNPSRRHFHLISLTNCTTKVQKIIVFCTFVVPIDVYLHINIYQPWTDYTKTSINSLKLQVPISSDTSILK